MADNFSFTQKAAAPPGFYPPQNVGQAFQKRSGDDRRQKTHFPFMGFFGNECIREDLEKEESTELEPKKRPFGSGSEKGTFWTVCPYCYYMYEYESKYEECCLRCENCKRGFHGLTVAAPPESSLVKGEGAYSGYVFYPLGCFGDSFLGGKKEGAGADPGKKEVVVEISSDESGDEEVVEKNEKEDVGEVKVEILSNGGGKGTMKRVKSVPRTSKKLMGRGVRVEMIPQHNAELGDSDSEIESE